MAREIKGAVYRIRTNEGYTRFVEADPIDNEDLFRFVIYEMIDKGYTVTSVSIIKEDGTMPRMCVLAHKDFKKMLSKHKREKAKAEDKR